MCGTGLLPCKRTALAPSRWPQLFNHLAAGEAVDSETRRAASLVGVLSLLDALKALPLHELVVRMEIDFAAYEASRTMFRSVRAAAPKVFGALEALLQVTPQI